MKFFSFAAPLMGGLLAFSVFTAPARADLVTFSGTPVTLRGVQVFPEATLQTKYGPVPLKLTGRGVRPYQGVLSLYVAASYVPDLDAWRKATSGAETLTDANRTALQAAVAAQPVRLLKLTMLTTLNSTLITKSFSSSLKLNNVSMDAPGIQDVLKNFDVTLKTGETAVIATWPDGDKQTLEIEALGKQAAVTETDLGTNFWKIWFGKVDNDLAVLQKGLVGSGK